jgi:hypothetical protein
VKAGVEHWATYSFLERGFASFEQVTSNIAECTNSWFGPELRTRDPVGAYYVFMLKTMRIFEQRRKTYTLSKHSLVPSARAQLQAHLMRAGGYNAVPCGPMPAVLFKVTYAQNDVNVSQASHDVNVSTNVRTRLGIYGELIYVYVHCIYVLVRPLAGHVAAVRPRHCRGGDVQPAVPFVVYPPVSLVHRIWYLPGGSLRIQHRRLGAGQGRCRGETGFGEDPLVLLMIYFFY